MFTNGSRSLLLHIFLVVTHLVEFNGLLIDINCTNSSSHSKKEKNLTVLRACPDNYHTLVWTSLSITYNLDKIQVSIDPGITPFVS